MNRCPFQTILLLSLGTMLIMACGTSIPPAIEPSPTQGTTQTLPANIPAATEVTGPAVTQTSSVDPVPAISFSRDILPIFESRCINCHGGRKTEKGLDLKTYTSLMSGSDEGAVLIPGDTDNSSIAQLLLEGKMPKRGPKLTPSQLQMVLEWIKSGAENN